MDIKKRMKSLLKQNSTDSTKSGKLGRVREPCDQFVISPTVTIRPPKYIPTDPLKDAELLKQIPEDMHQSEVAFDAKDYALQCARDDGFDVKKLEAKRKLVKKQLHAVNRKLSELILQKQPDYMNQLTQVGILEGQLGDAFAIGHCAARCIARVRQEFSDDNMQVLEDSAKHIRFQQLVSALDSIKTMQEADDRLRKLIDKGKFTDAIRLCKEHQAASNRLRHFLCIQEMSQKLNDIFVVLDEQLDVALARACCDFDQLQYEIIQNAYEMLGKTQMAVDQLHMHLANTLHSKVFAVVLSFVVRTNPTAAHAEGGEEALKKKQFKDLCELIPSQQFIHCFVALVKEVWFIMLNYHKLQRWHLQQIEQKRKMPKIVLPDADSPAMTSTAAVVGVDLAVDANAQNDAVVLPSSSNIYVAVAEQQIDDAATQYLRRKFERGPERIWLDIVQKLKIYLSTGNISKQCSYDEFLLLLALVHKMVAVGQEFASSSTEGRQLVELARTYSMSFFRQFEQQALEELRTLFEHEAWEPCPVKPGFTIADLWELRQFRPHLMMLAQQQQQQKSADGSTNSSTRASLDAGRHAQAAIMHQKSSTDDLVATAANSSKSAPAGGFFAAFYNSNSGTPFDEIIRSSEQPAGKQQISMYDDSNGNLNGSDNADGDNDDDDEHIAAELKARFVDEDADFDPMTRTLTKRSIHNDNYNALLKPAAAAREPAYKNAVTGATHAPIVSNVALNLLRLMGKCLAMVSVLDNISFTVVEAMTTLFGYYFYGIYHVFGTDMHDYFLPLITTPSLISTVRYLETNAVLVPQKLNPDAAGSIVVTTTQQQQQFRSLVSVDISSSSTTTVAVEAAKLSQNGPADSAAGVKKSNGLAASDSGANSDTQSMRSNNDDLSQSADSDAVSSSEVQSTVDTSRILLPPPERNTPMLELMNGKMGFGLKQRITATESLVFLAQQLELMRPMIIELVGPHHRPLIAHFYTQAVASAEDIRMPVYWTVAWRSINYDRVLQQMAEVKWAELSDLASQHSAYVDSLYNELEKFDKMLENASRHVFIPRAVYLTLWRHALLLAQRTFVEGFSNARQCTHEGRALMQLDYQQFLLKLEKLCPLKPLPNKEFVDAYIKAFYLPEDALEEFVVSRADNSKYSRKHLQTLIHVSPALGKRTRQRLLQQFDDS